MEDGTLYVSAEPSEPEVSTASIDHPFLHLLMETTDNSSDPDGWITNEATVEGDKNA